MNFVSAARKIAPVLALWPVFGGAARAQESADPNFSREGTLAQVRRDDFRSGNKNCRPVEPGSSLAFEFRILAHRAQRPDIMLMVCDSLLNLPYGTEQAYADDVGVVRITEGITMYPARERRAVEGHEIAHIANGHKMRDAQAQLSAFYAYDASLAALIEARARTGKPLAGMELAGYVSTWEGFARRADNAVSAAMEHNFPMEKDADVGGVIAAAGPACRIDIQSLIDALYRTEATMPRSRFRTVNFTHPDIPARAAYLWGNEEAILEACLEHFAP